ncbi:MAG: hypothetical protein KGD59_07930 [Candidatus Heimdallarchaeota archaeon]|nr:hypothetical protein [Candidatus Heimdallarchaeota archaeon]MBY8994465.1 hypothetical protein [Candidatus Heimdallarchaeota archaeon]
MFAKRSRSILEKFEEKNIIRYSNGANFFGQESLKLKQVRGNGVLVLTPKELYFEMWLPKRVYQIPIDSIIDIEVTKWHLRKTKSRDLLKVIFTNPTGETDSSAWIVRELDLWINDIRNLMMKRK